MDNGIKRPSAEWWRKLAEAYDTPLEQRTREQCKLSSHGRYFHRGICPILGNNFFARFLDDSFCLLAPPDEMRPQDDILYWWPRTDEGDRERAFFCLMMAAVEESGWF